jgi:hypothetical protein
MHILLLVQYLVLRTQYGVLPVVNVFTRSSPTVVVLGSTWYSGVQLYITIVVVLGVNRVLYCNVMWENLLRRFQKGSSCAKVIFNG